MILYHVDAKTGVRNYHLETPDQEEAEREFMRCWFEGQFWDVRIRRELRKEKDLPRPSEIRGLWKKGEGVGT